MATYLRTLGHVFQVPTFYPVNTHRTGKSSSAPVAVFPGALIRARASATLQLTLQGKVPMMTTRDNSTRSHRQRQTPWSITTVIVRERVLCRVQGTTSISNQAAPVRYGVHTFRQLRCWADNGFVPALKAHSVDFYQQARRDLINSCLMCAPTRAMKDRRRADGFTLGFVLLI